MPRVAFVSCRVLPEPDPDQQLLLTAARGAGLDAEMAPWDDPAVDWSRYALAVVRSSWNYYERASDFRAWIERTDKRTRLWNPAELLEFNIHKRYLSYLERKGVPTVPTWFIAPEFAGGLRNILEETRWPRFVLKPATSASSFMTRVFDVDEIDGAIDFLHRIHEWGDAMVQPYVSSVASGGEAALVYINGEITHAVTKNPRYQADEESVSAAFPPDPEQLAVARAAADAMPGQKLYGRIDLMRLDDGRWAVSEAEFIEPSLFFLQYPPALDRFMAAVARMV